MGGVFGLDRDGRVVRRSQIRNRTVLSRHLATTLQGGIICTSSSRPSDPFHGLRIYETDTDREYVYDGTNWVRTLGATTTVANSGDFTAAGSWQPNGPSLVLGIGRWAVRAICDWSWSTAGSGNDYKNRLYDATAGAQLGQAQGLRTQATATHASGVHLGKIITLTASSTIRVEGQVSSSSGTQFYDCDLEAIPLGA